MFHCYLIPSNVNAHKFTKLTKIMPYKKFKKYLINLTVTYLIKEPTFSTFCGMKIDGNFSIS